MLAFPNPFIDSFMAYTSLPLFVPLSRDQFGAILFNRQHFSGILLHLTGKKDGLILLIMPQICFFLRLFSNIKFSAGSPKRNIPFKLPTNCRLIHSNDFCNCSLIKKLFELIVKKCL